MPGIALADSDEFVVCDPERLSGLYVFSASGFNIVGGVAQPKAIVELIKFYGDGTLETPGATVSINGGLLIQNRPGSPGTYRIGPNCIGTLAFNDGPRFDLFMSPKGEDAWMIQTNPNTVMQGNVTRVGR
jgi:hypothetical protein